ncbi:MAG: glycosyltransferase [Pseudomonadota bacterium]|nr:glycosyltransferase [Pseudomonadota bacterium]
MKILINGHDLKFFYSIRAELEKNGHVFLEDIWKSHDHHDSTHSLRLIESADTIISEWALGNAIFYAENKKPHQRHIVRFHAQELRTEHCFKINYDNVDRIVFVGPHVMREAIKKFSIPEKKCVLISNYVDFEKFDIEKMGGNEYCLGIIGFSPMSKRLDRLIDVLEILVKKDKRYHIRVKGQMPFSYDWLWARTKERNYYENLFTRINSNPSLRYNVIFDPYGDDVPGWLRYIGFICSPSDSESFHMALAEGMASGAVPLTWKREGVNEIFKSNITFEDPEVIANYIINTNESNEFSRLSRQAKIYIKNNFYKQNVIDSWIDILKPSDDNEEKVLKNSYEKLFVIYGIDRWENFHRKEMLEALAKSVDAGTALFFIEPGNHYITLRDKINIDEDELKNDALCIPRKKGKNIYVSRIINSGYSKNLKENSDFQSLPSIYAEATRKYIKNIFGDNIKIIHWIYKPDQIKNLMQSDKYIYEVYDEYTRDFSTGALLPDVFRSEPAILGGAEKVVFTSNVLFERKRDFSNNPLLMGNGVDFSLFNKYLALDSEKSIAKKGVVSYLGNLSDFFDWELALHIVNSFPELIFNFYGQVEKHRLKNKIDIVESIMKCKNTFFAGRVSRDCGAAAVARSDVLIIPFVVNEAMDAVEPLKLWEYFATGRPVISSYMKSISHLDSRTLSIAHTRSEWIDLLRQHISNREICETRINIAKSKSWENLVRGIIT